MRCYVVEDAIFCPSAVFPYLLKYKLVGYFLISNIDSIVLKMLFIKYLRFVRNNKKKHICFWYCFDYPDVSNFAIPVFRGGFCMCVLFTVAEGTVKCYSCTAHEKKCEDPFTKSSIPTLSCDSCMKSKITSGNFKGGVDL